MENLVTVLLVIILGNIIHLEVQSALNRRDIRLLMDKVCPSKSKERDKE